MCKSTCSQVKVTVSTRAKPKICYAKGYGRNSKLPANGAQQHAHLVLTDAVSCSLLKTHTAESVESHTNRPLLIIIKNPAENSTQLRLRLRNK
jgi:hypothetical protein